MGSAGSAHFTKKCFLYSNQENCPYHFDEKHLDFLFLTVQRNTFKFGFEGGSSIAYKLTGTRLGGFG